mgnify:CR=1 FL=1
MASHQKSPPTDPAPQPRVSVDGAADTQTGRAHAAGPHASAAARSRRAPRHFLGVDDVGTDGARRLLDLAWRIKREPADWRTALAGQSLAMIFQKSSTRTRVSFEVGMVQLGGHALFLSAQDMQIGRGETIADTARVLSRYCDGIMARVYGHSDLEELARYANVPVINGLSDRLHPCQTMADALTLAERFSPVGRFDPLSLVGRKLCYVGDAANNMANSLMITGATLGMHVSVLGPRAYWPDEAIVDQARTLAGETGAEIVVSDEPAEALEGADAIYTDVWTSMGQETERDQRLRDLAGYQVNADLMALARPDACFMHCLPAHRGEEVSAEVCDGPQSLIFDEAENRLHAQKALLVELMGHLG